MLAIKGEFDGKCIVLPTTPQIAKCPVIVVFEEDVPLSESELTGWLLVQESALAEAWDNEEDAVYDRV